MLQPRTVKYLRFSATAVGVMAGLAACPALAVPFSFSTGDPDGKIATAALPAGGGLIETQTADDFILSSQTSIDHASFTGLLTNGAGISDINQVAVDIFRVFPNDSDTGRTPNVPTRLNSPADAVFAGRDAAAGTLNFSVNLINNSFTANNSVLYGGIHPLPNPNTGGDGAVTGMEVQFDISFTTALNLAADHYFFAPEVGLNTGEFLWLSAPKPIVPPGNPFVPDLQSWIRDANLSPDWLRIGTDIVGGSPAPTFNAAFSISGDATGTGTGSIPEPSTLLLFSLGAAGMNVAAKRKKSQRRQK